MTRDRLEEMHNFRKAHGLLDTSTEKENKETTKKRTKKNTDISPDQVQIHMNESSSYQKFMRFLNEIDDIRAQLENVNLLVIQLEQLNSKLSSQVEVTTEDTNEVNSMKLSIDQSYDRCNKHLKQLEEQLVKDRKDCKNEADAHSAYIRSRQHHLCSLRNDFKKTLMKYNDSQLNAKNTWRQMLRREIEIGQDRSVTDTELDEILEKGPGQVQTFAQVAQDTREAKQVFQRVKDRHEEIVKIEKSLEVMKELFLQLNVLVMEQGVMLDNIEHSVQEAGEYTADAGKELTKARDNQKKARKKKFICAIIIIVIILIIAAIIAIAAATG